MKDFLLALFMLFAFGLGTAGCCQKYHDQFLMYMDQAKASVNRAAVKAEEAARKAEEAARKAEAAADRAEAAAAKAEASLSYPINKPPSHPRYNKKGSY